MKDAVAIQAVATGCTIAEAARRSGQSERTLRRRLAQPEFAARVEHTRAEIVSRVAGRLTVVADAAVAALEELLQSDQSPATRLRAAQVILSHGARYREVEEIDARLVALENAALHT